MSVEQMRDDSFKSILEDEKNIAHNDKEVLQPGLAWMLPRFEVRQGLLYGGTEADLAGGEGKLASAPTKV